MTRNLLKFVRPIFTVTTMNSSAATAFALLLPLLPIAQPVCAETPVP